MLRAIAQVDPGLFREILTFARARYETDRATYHVSAKLDHVSTEDALSNTDLPSLLDQFDARQVIEDHFDADPQLVSALKQAGNEAVRLY